MTLAVDVYRNGIKFGSGTATTGSTSITGYAETLSRHLALVRIPHVEITVTAAGVHTGRTWNTEILVDGGATLTVLDPCPFIESGGLYSAPAVHFDGATWLHIASLTSTDNARFSFAGWMKLSAANFDGGNSVFIGNYGGSSSAAFGGVFVGTRSVSLQVGTSDGASNSQVSSSTGQSADQWICVIASIDTSGASGVAKLYIGDTDVGGATADTSLPCTVQTNGLPFGFCNDNFGDFVTGDFADWRIMPGTSLLTAGDIPLATRRLFITAGGKPVDPATATATLGAPCILFSGTSSGFGTNQGSGGSFTLTGSLTNASTSPST